MEEERPQSASWRGEHSLPTDEPQLWEVGSLRFWCRTHQNDFWLAFEHVKDAPENLPAADGEAAACVEPPEEPLSPEPPEDADWTRWALKENYDRMRLSPVFPDLPVVVRPEAAFVLAPRVELRVYVRCPLWVKIELVGGKTERQIKELPTAVLSNTWFGDFLEGMLSYWISSGARRELEPDPSRTHLAICPIHIINRSDEDLSVEKICLRVGQLSLYEAEGQLWADEMRVVYRGSADISQLEAVGKAPPVLKGATKVAPPRDAAHRGFSAKTFLPLKMLSSLGAWWD